MVRRRAADGPFRRRRTGRAHRRAVPPAAGAWSPGSTTKGTLARPARAAPESTADRYYAAFNARDLDAWLETLADDVEIVTDAGVVHGRLAARVHLEGILHAFPGVTVVDRRVVAESADAVVSEFHLANPTAALAPDPSASDGRRAPWRLDGVTCEVLRLRGDRVASLHSFSWRTGADRTPAAEVPSRSAAARTAHRQPPGGATTQLVEVAEIAAAGTDPAQTFSAVTRSASAVLGGHPTSLIRFVDEDTADALAHTGVDIPSPGGRFRIDPDSVTALVQRTGRPARIDDYRTSHENRVAHLMGLRASVGVPVAVGGQPWGMLSATSTDGPLPVDTERRLTQFVGTVAAAIAGAQARAELRALADEQAALRRVAELVARGAHEHQIYDAVTTEAAGIIGQATTLIRFDAERALTLVASSPGRKTVGDHVQLTPADERLVAQVLDTRKPVRVENYTRGTGQTTYVPGLASRVGVPIIVDGRLWGVLAATTDDRRLPTMVEHRLQQFGGLMAAAVANAQARGQLKEFAEEQSALRRVAELAAHDAPADQLLQAVAVEASALAGVEFGMVLRYVDTAGASEIVALDGAPDNFVLGMRAPGTGDGAVHRVWRTGRAARVDDLSQMTGRWSTMAHQRGFTASAGVPIVMRGALWGALIVAGRGDSFPTAIEDHLAHFAELAGSSIAATHAREELRMLADEQASLRRVAELAAHNAPAEVVLQSVAREAAALTGVDFTTLLRYEADGSTQIIALDGAPDGIVVGMRAPNTGDGAVQRVWRTGQPARIDNLGAMSGVWPQLAHRHGFNASAAVPIVIRGALWGALVVVGRREAFPHPIEEHLANFAELAGTAVSAADARRELRLLADEQAALRRVAELVARGATLDEVFTAAATEASTLLGRLAAALLRYDDGDVAIAVAVCRSPVPLGLRVPADSADTDNALSIVRRTGRPIRVDTFEGTSLAHVAVDMGVAAGVAVPVTVEGRVWGALTASTAGPTLPVGSEARLTPFAELVAAAIANAENKTKLTASRARVVATADETRRRLQRDVHDGAQQRLVHTIIALKLARDALAQGEPAAGLLREALTNAERANSELRDIVRGILPASLTRGGLRSGLESLVADLALPVDLTFGAPRLPAWMETTAYFVVAEAMTNIVKHARASRAAVDVRVHHESLIVEIHDDGVGGADPTGGTGLTGLFDRVEASDGTLTVTSFAGAGTTIRATFPVGEHLSATGIPAGPVSARPWSPSA